MLVFEEGKTGVPGEKPLGARTKTNNKLNPHMTPGPRVEPGPIGERRALSSLRHPCSPKYCILVTIVFYFALEP